MRLDARRLSSAGNCERGLPGSAWASGPARPEHRVAFATNAESVRSVRRSNCQDLWIMFSGRVGEVSKEQGAVVVRDQASGADRGLHGVVRVPRVGPWRIMSIDPAVLAAKNSLLPEPGWPAASPARGSCNARHDPRRCSGPDLRGPDPESASGAGRPMRAGHGRLPGRAQSAERDGWLTRCSRVPRWLIV